MGVSVVDYINTVRVHKAIAMFDTTKQSAAQIAKKCGFSSVSNFNRVFKRHTGNPPTFYKK
jgi:AraC-like DNA-binding protein